MSNHFGQPGIGGKGQYTRPTKIPHHSLVVGLDGRVYGFGLNDQGQVGPSRNIQVKAPRLIDDLKARQVAAGIIFP